MVMQIAGCAEVAMTRVRLAAVGLAALVLLTPVARSAPATPDGSVDLMVRVDAREVMRNHVHTDLALAVKGGPLTLVYPKWIPGYHSPSGPLESLIRLEISAKGQTLPWKRDPINMYALIVNVPTGVDHLDISLDSGLATEGDGGARTASAQLAVLPFNEIVLFPKGGAERITAMATVRPPPGWHVECPLESRVLPDGSVQLEKASMTRLIDSPVQIGRYMARVELAGAAPLPQLKHVISIAADSPEALKLPDDFAAGYDRLVAEAGALFGTRMYRHYTWLLTLSDRVEHTGVEHHESSDDRREERALLEAPMREGVATLLVHEYVHSWNGKYRRPVGLLSPDYQKPMEGALLWVYEGMTQFWGNVLATRAGLLSPESYREALAVTAGRFDIEPGSRWRPLADTAVAAQILYNAPDAWSSSRRSIDFYDGSVPMWLNVDAEIRARTQWRASLDEFAKRFCSGPGGEPALKPYVESEVYAILAAVAPGDWQALIHKHLDGTGPAALLAGVESTGWKLAYSPEKNSWLEYVQKRRKTTERAWSVGLRLDEKATIIDTIEGGPAARAGAGAGMKLIAINGRKYSPDVLDAAVAAAHESRQPIELLVETDDFYRTLSVSYFDGPRFPHLARIEGKPDTLSELLKPRVH
jgi:predicted metalloprotease with PDZ domain